MEINKIFLTIIILFYGSVYSMNLDNKKDHNNLVKKLIKASLEGNLKQVELLIKIGVDVNSKDNDGNTALIESAKYAEKKIVRLLIKKSANVNEKNNEGNNVLINAMMPLFVSNYMLDTRKEIIELLIKSGADLNEKDNEGNTPLMLVSIYDLKDIAELINFAIEKREEIQKWKKVLFDAIDANKYKLVKYLIKNKVTLNIYDQNGNNALHLAAFNNKPEIFKLILSVRPDLIQQKNKDGKTPIEINPAFDNYSLIKDILEIKD